MEKFNIFVGDLSYFCTEGDLERLFSTIGEVRGTIIRRGKQGDTLHYGFVNMSDEDAITAVNKLQGQNYMGRRLRLNIESLDDGPKMRGKNAHGYPQVHIRSQVNEELLARLFSRFGTIVDCVVKQYCLTINPHRQSGYGFVFYRTEEDAWRAINAVKNSTIDGIKFDCSFSREYQPSSNPNNNHTSDINSSSFISQSTPQYSQSPTALSLTNSISTGNSAVATSGVTDINSFVESHTQQYHQSTSPFMQHSTQLIANNARANSFHPQSMSVYPQQQPQHRDHHITNSAVTTSYVHYAPPQPQMLPSAAHHLTAVHPYASHLPPTFVSPHNFYFDPQNNHFIQSSASAHHHIPASSLTPSNNVVYNIMPPSSTRSMPTQHSNQFPPSPSYNTFR